MAERRGVAGAGNWIIDQVKVVDRFPEEERLAIILEESRGTGGAPYNVLVGLRALDPGLRPPRTPARGLRARVVGAQIGCQV